MRRVAVLVLLCLLTTACAKMVEVKVIPIDLEPVDLHSQTLVFAADGSHIGTFRFQHRTLVERDEVPPVLVDAVIAAEDRRFWEHDGLDYRAILRAALANRRAGRVVQGGSTITQQLVKNLYFPDPEQTMERKVQEAHLARDLERRRSKDEILVDYLNTIYLGAGAYGVQAAARVYFGVKLADLTLPQAALLAGLIRSPESASPYDHPEVALAERTRVLRAMAEEEMIRQSEADEALSAPLELAPPPQPPVSRYPYFLEYVKRVLLSDPALGPDEASRVRQLFGGGLRIHTTIDPQLQQKAEAATQAYWSGAHDPEVAMAVVEPSTGHLVAAVGGRDFAVRKFDLATQAERQPGSAFKTYGLVAALRAGMQLDDRIDSGSARLRLVGGGSWRVRSGTAGMITLRAATARSSNGAFARLAVRLGGARIAEQAKLMGITTPLDTNPAIVLGGLTRGVSPLQMASGYATLSNGGVHMPPIAVTKITDKDGRLVWQPQVEPRVAMDAEVAWQATQALRGVVEHGTGRAARLSRPAAGKTGTSQRNRDAWFVGYTPQLSAAVWIGYPDQERPLLNVHGVGRVQGGTWPARIWRLFMESAHADLPVVDFTYPEHLETTVMVDPTSGQLAGPWCPLSVPRTGLPSDLPREQCTVHGPPPPKTALGGDGRVGVAEQQPADAGGASAPPAATATAGPAPEPTSSPSPTASPSPQPQETSTPPPGPEPSPSPSPTPQPTSSPAPQPPPGNGNGNGQAKGHDKQKK